MADRIVGLLAPALTRPDALFVDATIGAGGHALAVARACPAAQILGIDRDPAALALTRAAFDREPALAGRLTLVAAVFDRIAAAAADLGRETVDAVLFDLGISSMQVDDDARGFAYSRDVALDMRMNPAEGPSAADIVNTYPVARLAAVLRDFGEERHAERIARAIARRRAEEPVTRSADLARIVADALPAAARRSGRNPAKRSFQALRIEVNGELEALAAALPQAIGLLGLGGRIAVLSYHSLEDRLVKRTLVGAASSSAPRKMPVEPEAAKPRFQLLTRGAERPTEQEVAANPRSASARLRAAERIRGRAA
jgi:16S rRNA (cytosine1402-N4)-methyltransferase